MRKTFTVFAIFLLSVFLFTLLFTLFLLPGTARQTSAEEYPVPASNRTVRVAFPVQKGMTDIVNGKYTGYTYEYLQEIAQHAGWDVEFVVEEGDLNESLSGLMEKLARNEIDLMGGMLYSEEMNELYNYSSYSYGTVETVLQVPATRAEVPVINSQVHQTIRVALINPNGRMAKELLSYSSVNLIDPEFIVCADEAEMMDAVESGRADALLNTSFNYLPGYRTIGRFMPKPFFFIAPKDGCPNIMEELNYGLAEIAQSTPYFSAMLYEKYFPATTAFQLDQSEKDYLAGKATLRVGYLSSLPPYQYRNENGVPAGIGVDLIKRFAVAAGLAVEFTEAANVAALTDLCAKNTVDVVASIPYNYDLAQQAGVSLSRQFVSAAKILVLRSDLEVADLSAKRLARIKFADTEITAGSEIICDNMPECLNAIRKNEADFAYVDSYTAQYFVNQPDFGNIKLISQNSDPMPSSFGIVKSQKELLPIINKFIASMPLNELQTVVNDNIIYKTPYTLGAFIRDHVTESIAIIVSFTLFVVALLSVILFQIYHSAKKDRRNLEKHRRVYALSNDIFFEYDYKKKTYVFSDPSASEHAYYRYTYRENDPHYAALEKNELCRIIRSAQTKTEEVYIEGADKKFHWLNVIMETVFNASGAPLYTIGRAAVIDDQKTEKENLMEKATIDGLTQVLNAETFKNRVADALAGEQTSGALFIVDVDNFKAVNDNFGHLQGDQTLKKVAETLKRNFRENDLVGRAGGDEFVVFMSDPIERAALKNKCAQLTSAVRALNGAKISVSIGCAVAAKDETFDSLYRRADNAMYRAKEAGKDGYKIAE